MRLLIVDDSAMIRKSLESYLTKLQLEVVGVASNGLEAVSLFETLLPDLVTLDITMPEMDGLSALKHMLAKKPNAKVIIISALNSKETIVEALNAGASGYIAKPYTADKLKAEIEKVMGATK